MITRFSVIYLYFAFRFGNAPKGFLHCCSPLPRRRENLEMPGGRVCISAFGKFFGQVQYSLFYHFWWIVFWKFIWTHYYHPSLTHFILFQFVNKVGGSEIERPTYVYPSTLKAIIREISPGDIKAHTDPSGPRVSFSCFLLSKYLFSILESVLQFWQLLRRLG